MVLPSSSMSAGGQGEPLGANFELPVVRSDASAKIAEALRRSAVERKAIAVFGSKGSGKSIALTREVASFNADEARLAKSRREEGYVPRRILHLGTPRAKKPKDLFAVIHRVITGMEIETRSRNGTKPDAVLCQELADQLASNGVAGLAFDEAEGTTEVGLTALRDLMSACESAGRLAQPLDSIVPVGIGVVLVGTPGGSPVIEKWSEAGHRMVSELHIRDLNPHETAALYPVYLPGLEGHVKRVGLKAWTAFLTERVIGSLPAPMRLIESHCRNYVRLFVEANPHAASLYDVDFNEKIFIGAIKGHPAFERTRNMSSGP